MTSGLSRYIKSFERRVFSEDELTGFVGKVERLKEGSISGREHVANLKSRFSNNTTCPKCGKSLVQRTARKGLHAGNLFLGCSGLPPSRQIVGSGQFSTDFDDLANGVQQQVNICGKMHVSLHHKGITTTYDAIFQFFFNTVCPAWTITRLSRSRISGVNSRRLSLRVCRL